MNRYFFGADRLRILVLVLSSTAFVLNSSAILVFAIQNPGSGILGSTDGKNVRPQNEDPPNAWRSIVPLRSTREDVQKLLGTPLSSHGSTVVWETAKEKVDVVFSVGKCVLSGSEKWNVPSDVVITIDVRPKKPIRIQALNLDPKKYPRFQRAHPENWFVYRDKEDEVMVETVQFEKNEQVDSISYFPTTKDQNLGCPNEPSLADSGETGSVKMDEYGFISFKEEAPRLDGFATELTGWTGARIHNCLPRPYYDIKTSSATCRSSEDVPCE